MGLEAVKIKGKYNLWRYTQSRLSSCHAFSFIKIHHAETYLQIASRLPMTNTNFLILENVAYFERLNYNLTKKLIWMQFRYKEMQKLHLSSRQVLWYTKYFSRSMRNCTFRRICKTYKFSNVNASLLQEGSKNRSDCLESQSRQKHCWVHLTCGIFLDARAQRSLLYNKSSAITSKFITVVSDLKTFRRFNTLRQLNQFLWFFSTHEASGNKFIPYKVDPFSEGGIIYLTELYLLKVKKLSLHATILRLGICVSALFAYGNSNFIVYLKGNVSTYMQKKYKFSKECKLLAWTGDNPQSIVGMALQDKELTVSNAHIPSRSLQNRLQ